MATNNRRTQDYNNNYEQNKVEKLKIKERISKDKFIIKKN